MNPSAKPSWWTRNWKWFVPTGCFTLVALLVGFIALLVYAAAGMMKSSDAYREAVVKARSSPAVVKELGEPIQEGFLVSGNVNVSGPTGEADLAIPLSGPRGRGTLYAVATKSAGEWTFVKLRFKGDGGAPSIDLLKEGLKPAAP